MICPSITGMLGTDGNQGHGRGWSACSKIRNRQCQTLEFLTYSSFD